MREEEVELLSYPWMGWWLLEWHIPRFLLWFHCLRNWGSLRITNQLFVRLLLIYEIVAFPFSQEQTIWMGTAMFLLSCIRSFMILTFLLDFHISSFAGFWSSSNLSRFGCGLWGSVWRWFWLYNFRRFVSIWNRCQLLSLHAIIRLFCFDRWSSEQERWYNPRVLWFQALGTEVLENSKPERQIDIIWEMLAHCLSIFNVLE